MLTHEEETRVANLASRCLWADPTLNYTDCVKQALEGLPQAKRKLSPEQGKTLRKHIKAILSDMRDGSNAQIQHMLELTREELAAAKSMREHAEAELTEACTLSDECIDYFAHMRLSASTAEPDKPDKPLLCKRIVIAGLLPQQMQIIQDRLPDVDLRFWGGGGGSGESIHKLKAMCVNADHVLAFSNFISHKATYAVDGMVMVSGGLTTLYNKVVELCSPD